MGKKLSILALFLIALPAFAEELQHYPGWKLQKIEQAVADGAVQSGPEYYGLTPPDNRPAVTIDARSAKLLMAGEGQPEAMYGGSAIKIGKDSATKEDFAYSQSKNGFHKMDDIASTLPGYDWEANGSTEIADASPDSSSAVSGFSSTGANGKGSGYFGGSGRSRSPKSSASSGSAGSASGGVVDFAAPSSARAGASSGGNAGASVAPGDSSGASEPVAGISTGNLVASSGNMSFGTVRAPASESDGDEDNDGIPDEDDPDYDGPDIDIPDSPAVCQGQTKTYNNPKKIRIKLPEGCGNIVITAWGAGGGDSIVTQSQGSDRPELRKEVKGEGGSYVQSMWKIDASKYDLVVVVGKAGAQGAGGGFSGVFVADKNNNKKQLKGKLALGVAAGGDSATGAKGKKLRTANKIKSAQKLQFITEKNDGKKPGMQYHLERGNAGTAGKDGKVILQYMQSI